MEIAAKILAADAPVEAWAGRVLAHYRIEEKIGAGGMGVVYRAEDLHLHRPVALKVPDKMTDPERKRRFITEARAASALTIRTSSRFTTSPMLWAWISLRWSMWEVARLTG